LAVDYYGMDEKHFICSSIGNYLGYLYVCNFEEDRPTDLSFVVDPFPINFINKTKDTNFLMIGREDGQIILKN